MKKIASFTVNHINLLRGIYVSRKDTIGENTLTTFDIRMKRPNREPVMNTSEIHAMEHLAATFLRNHDEYDNKTIYFGPMGCRTGFYVIFKGDLESKDVINIITEMFTFISQYEGDIPGAAPKDCGNYLDMNLPMAKHEAKKFLEEVLKNIKDENLVYPS
ncbi:MAG: S-ribosylhomocysteine lyase [Vallitalea sp.]|jgi:S-ribosylhomocysteine lyase|nr:S-ribosylhomocysteine lyase [Vallitalea sp.]